MSQWDLQANETSVYFKNYVNDEVVEAVQKKFMEGYDTIYVSFDVIGRTRHEYLSYQLGSRLRALYGPKVNMEVDYNYQCVVRWLTNLDKEVAKEELSTGAGCDASDLISRSELYNELRNRLTWLMAYGDDIYSDVDSDIKNVIDNMPTAYDIDNVVKELKDSLKIYCEEYNQRDGNLYLLDAIEIVKRGRHYNENDRK